MRQALLEMTAQLSCCTHAAGADLCNAQLLPCLLSRGHEVCAHVVRGVIEVCCSRVGRIEELQRRRAEAATKRQHTEAADETLDTAAWCADVWRAELPVAGVLETCAAL